MMKALITSKIAWVVAMYYLIGYLGNAVVDKLDAVSSAISF